MNATCSQETGFPVQEHQTLVAVRRRSGWSGVRDVRTIQWLGLALTLLVAHVTLAVSSGSATAAGPVLVSVVLQGVAVAAVLTRWRSCPGEARQLWLLLALAMFLHVVSGAVMFLAILVGGPAEFGLAIVAVVLSGLYMVPAMFMIARTFSPDMPRTVHVLDSLIAVCVVVLLSALTYEVATMPHEAMMAHVKDLSFLADAVNYSLAALVTIRFVGATTKLRRHAYFAAAAFLWINALSISGYNRLEQGGLPWWGGLLLQLGFITVIPAALGTVPVWLRRMRPSRMTTSVIDGFAPIVLSVSVLALGISVSRLDFGVGMIVSVLSVLFYGLRMAYIQSRDRYRQRVVTLSNERLQQQLGIDPMTGIANRGALDVHLREVLQNKRRGAGACSVLMVDVDFFKQYNDLFGHIAGDACLLRVVDALRSHLLRSGDLIARYGGEEFAVVLPDSSEHAAKVVGQRLVDSVAELGIAHPGSPYDRVTVSVGVVTCATCSPEQAIELMEAADRALYRAKRHGRNRCEAEQPHHGRAVEVLSS